MILAIWIKNFPKYKNPAINQLFPYIYYDQSTHYRSDMWGIQSTLYLYGGHLVSALVVLLIAYVLSRYWMSIDASLKKSPAYFTLIILITLDILENGTIERVVPVDIIRTLVCFFTMIFLVKLLHLIIPVKKRIQI